MGGGWTDAPAQGIFAERLTIGTYAVKVARALASLMFAALLAGTAGAEGWPNRPLGFVTIPDPAPHAQDDPKCYRGGHYCADRRVYPVKRYVPPAQKPAAPRTVTLADARALLDAGRFDAAHAALSGLSRTTPQDPAVWTLLGRTERRLARLDAASESLRRALALDPGNPAALAEQGLLFLARGEPVRAQETLADLTQSCGGCVEAAALRSALTGAGYHAGGTGAKWIRVQP